jgi:hypothetical protein
MNAKVGIATATAKSDRSLISRRNFLLAGAGVSAILAAVAVEWVQHPGGAGKWIEDIVRRNLPGIELDETSLHSFVGEVLASEQLDGKHQWFYSTAMMPTRWLGSIVPVLRQARERIERQVLTRYLIGSNFFRVPDPTRETIFYVGTTIGCGNPFASLGPAEPLTT